MRRSRVARRPSSPTRRAQASRPRAELGGAPTGELVEPTVRAVEPAVLARDRRRTRSAGPGAAASSSSRPATAMRWRALAATRWRRVVEPGDELVDLSDEQLRARGGGLAGGVRDLVGDAAVDLVADAGEHRYPHRRDRPRHELGVEGGEVGARTTAAGEHDDVDVELRRAVPTPT